jgi:uncharacterized protein (DUF885 family)
MAETPSPISALADELVDLLIAKEPLQSSVSGVGTAHDRLPDLSLDAEQAYRARFADLVDRAAAVPESALPDEERITRAVLIQQAGMSIDLIDSKSVEFTVSDFFISPAAGLFTNLPAVSVANPELAEAYLNRLAAIPAYLDAAAARHRIGSGAGRTPVRRLVHAAIRQIESYLAEPVGDELRKQSGTELFLSRQEELLADVVRPAFAAYQRALADELLPVARPDEQPGLCWLPEGEPAYALLARAHTSTERTPQDLHDTGLSLIEQLAEEYREIGGRVFGTTDLTEIFHRVRTDPALRWTSSEQVLATARSTLRRATDAAPDWFGFIPPGQPCEVLPTPPSAADSAVPMYYLPAALDGSRPGVYYANTNRVTERARIIAEAVAFHEGLPGHHFQFSVKDARTSLPLLRKLAEVNAYVEGWGLYSERLADEMGLYSDDLARLGMLVCDSWRAGRLVVDTGMHVLGWSRDKAVDYLRRQTPMTTSEIHTEIDRYIGYPGQALAYMVGRLEIQRMRAAATTALGARFDIRAFHDVLLGSGPLPLSVLDEVISEWIELW